MNVVSTTVFLFRDIVPMVLFLDLPLAVSPARVGLICERSRLAPGLRAEADPAQIRRFGAYAFL
jgi:hypothetical protein